MERWSRNNHSKAFGTVETYFLTNILNSSLNTASYNSNCLERWTHNTATQCFEDIQTHLARLPTGQVIWGTIITPELIEHVPLAHHHHGFRKGHNTTTALHTITDNIQKGLYQGSSMPTIMYFCTVSWAQLFQIKLKNAWAATLMDGKHICEISGNSV